MNLLTGISGLRVVKCASRKSCVVFMPRIDLWAVEAETPPNEEVECDDDSVKENSSPVCLKTVEKKEVQNFARVSRAWNTFLEQVESLRVSTKMMILVCLTSLMSFSTNIFLLMAVDNRLSGFLAYMFTLGFFVSFKPLYSLLC